MNEALYKLQKYMITYDMLDGSDYDKYNKLKYLYCLRFFPP